MSRRTRAALGWLVLFAAGITVWGAQGSQPARAQPEELTSAERQQAAAIYANQCASCHGSSGQGAVMPGTNSRAPALAGNPQVTVPYVDLVLRVGRMPPPENEPFDNRSRNPTLDDEERRVLVAYLAEAFDLEGEIPEVGEGDPARGREVYAANCAACHGSTGAGGVAGAGAWTPPVSSREPVTIAEAIRVGPFQMPQFSAEQIPDDEVADVAAFLEEVEEEEGTLLFGLIELNPVYASAFAALLTLVVVAAVLIIAGKPTWFPDPEGQHPRAPAAGRPPDEPRAGRSDKDHA